jgi:predicted RNase H-like HicB family nuclease
MQKTCELVQRACQPGSDDRERLDGREIDVARWTPLTHGSASAQRLARRHLAQHRAASGIGVPIGEQKVETRYYPAIVERGAEGYGVFFPDLPGCVSAGGTLQEAARNAEEALQLHVEGTIEDGDPLPAPSELDAIERDPEVDEAARILVRVDVPKARARPSEST